MEIIRAMTQRPVIAVDVASPPNRHLDFEDLGSWWSTFAHRAYRRPLILETLMKAYDIPQRLLTDARVALNPPDIFVRPPIDAAIKVEDFDKWQQPYDAGYEATQLALEEFGERIGLGDRRPPAPV